jgi:prepilin-type N-terminal cleavage/methylation domain-containing protein
MDKSRSAFTMIELIFVIVIMGILAKFGVELIRKTYEGYTRSMILNQLETKSEAAIQQIANRLQYRIKDSELASGTPLLSNAGGEGRLEWIGMDIDGWNNGNWSGIVDLNHPSTSKTTLATPATSSIGAGDAIIFIGGNRNVLDGLWNESNNSDIVQTHRVTGFTAGSPSVITIPNTAGTARDIWEYYKVSKTAFAIEQVGSQLILRSGYQPWASGSPTHNYTNASLLLDHVATPGFSFQKLGDIIKIEICVSDNDFMGEGEYKICKHKVIF